MKKHITITAFLVSAGVAMATTPTEVTNGSITLDGTQSTDVRLDFTYSTTASQNVTTTADSVTIEGCDGYGLTTTNTVLTFNVLGTLNATKEMKLATGDGGSLVINTALKYEESTRLSEGEIVSRDILTADVFSSIASKSVTLNLSGDGIEKLQYGGALYFQSTSGNYYRKEDITFADGKYATVKSGATGVALEEGCYYLFSKITADSGASVKGFGFVAVAIPEPSAFGFLAALGTLALVGVRRRRR